MNHKAKENQQADFRTFFSTKKGDASMWWIIIGAVLALVVMIILMVLFTGKTRPLDQGLSDCNSKGGICVAARTLCPQNSLKSSVFSCDQGGECCVGSPRRWTGVSGCSESVTDLDGQTWCK